MTEVTPWAPQNAVSDYSSRAVERLGEWAISAQAAYQVAERLVESSFVPAQFKGKPVEAAAAILAGVEVGLQPMAALRSFDIIQGTAAARAMTLRAIVQSHGHEIEQVEATSSRCVMQGRRRGAHNWQKVTWTIDRAKEMGLTGKDNWKKQPQAMLVARATSEIARLIASDAILGIGYSVEEIQDGAGEYTAMASESAAPPATRTVSRAPESITDAQSKKLHALVNEFGWDRDVKLAFASQMVGRTLGSTSELTKSEAVSVIDALEQEVQQPEAIEPADDLPPERPLTTTQSKAITAQIKRTGIDKDDYLARAREITGRDIGGTKGLTEGEAVLILDALVALPDAGDANAPITDPAPMEGPW